MAKYNFRLFIIKGSPPSERALVNVPKALEKRLKGNYHVKIVDIEKNADLARSLNVLVAPTLIKDSPSPVMRFLGDFSDEEKGFRQLGFDG